MIRLILYMVVTLLCSCTNGGRKQHTRDLLLSEFIAYHDSTALSDSTDQYYRMLKFYHNNDTAAMKDARNNIAETWQAIKGELKGRYSTCGFPDARLLRGYDEAYQFAYEAFSCNTLFAITVWHKDSTFGIKVNEVVVNYQTQTCEKTVLKEMSIKESDWNNLLSSIHYADFWNGKGQNNLGFDGSTLVITGYHTRNVEPRFHTISRWLPEETVFIQLYNEVLSLAELRNGCLERREKLLHEAQ